MKVKNGKNKSNMQSWAEREVEIACRHERAGNETREGEWDYGCACYKSALKAYKSLLKDGHSGASIMATKNILNRLIDGKPLTQIDDTDDVWNEISEYRPEEGYRDYQCKRMSHLFKSVYADGRIVYRDINSHYCIDLNNQSTFHSGLVQRIMDEMFPISMPYMPEDPIKVYREDFLTDKKNGDFDTIGVFYAIKPNGEKIEINRFFKESVNDKTIKKFDSVFAPGWEEIDKAEYEERKEDSDG